MTDKDIPEATPVATAHAIPAGTVTQTFLPSVRQPTTTEPARAQFLTGNDPALAVRRKNHSSSFGLGLACIGTGDLDLKGVVTLNENYYALILMHGGKFDFSRATFLHPKTTIRFFCVCGGIQVVIPRGVNLEVKGLGICGAVSGLDSNSVEHHNPTSDAPTVCLQGIAICGGTSVEITVAVEPLVIIQQDQA